MADEQKTDDTADDDKPVAKPKTRKFVVREGHSIFVASDEHKHGEKKRAGAVVELTATEAKHYVKRKAIDPYVGED